MYFISFPLGSIIVDDCPERASLVSKIITFLPKIFSALVAVRQAGLPLRLQLVDISGSLIFLRM